MVDFLRSLERNCLNSPDALKKISIGIQWEHIRSGFSKKALDFAIIAAWDRRSGM